MTAYQLKLATMSRIVPMGSSVLERVKRDAAHVARRGVTQVVCRQRAGQFVHRKGDDQDEDASDDR